jgi:hypothetical protein
MLLPLLLLLLLQPLDKLERVELRKQAEQFVEPGFKLVMQVRASASSSHCTQQLVCMQARSVSQTRCFTTSSNHTQLVVQMWMGTQGLQMQALSAASD